MRTVTRRVFSDVDTLATAAAAEIARVVRERHAEGERPSVALTGGTAGIRTATALLGEVVPWAQTDVFYGDERFLASGDPDRNDVQLDDALFGRLGGPPPRLHRWPVRSPDLGDVAAAAESFLLDEGETRLAAGFDVHLLGMGGEGHVNSVFPGTPGVLDSAPTVLGVRDCPKPPPERMTLTLPVVRRSRHVFLVVAGADKADAVARALKPGARAADLPAAGCVGTVSTVWFLDEDAASLL